MGEITIKKWRCDRCGAIHDKRPDDGGSRYSVAVSVDYRTAGGPMIDWKEMCPTCDRAVESIIKSLKAIGAA